MQKISRVEAQELKDSWEKKAEALAQFYSFLGYKDIRDGHFFSKDLTPCCYGYASWYTYMDPKTGKERRGKKLPKEFRDAEKKFVWDLYHFSPSGCASLRPFYSVVECLAQIEYDYWYTRHRVGQCPHKIITPPDPPPRELPPDLIPPYISEAIISHDELFLKPALERGQGPLPGEFPKEYRRKNLPLAQYLEHNGSMIWLFEYGYNLSKLQKYFQRYPRPANQEIFPRVAIYDDSYWERGAPKKPLRVIEKVNLKELLEILKEFAPTGAR